MKISISKYAYIIVFLLLGYIENAAATSVMVLQHKNGETIRYNFSVHPIISFEEKTMILTSDETVISYVMSDYEKLYFEDEETKIEEINGASDTDTVLVYDIKGNLLKTARNVLNYSHLNLPKGIYIIKKGKSTLKISIK